MASTATTRNRLNKQGTGDNTGTWGNVLNTQGIDLIDEALDGFTSIAISGNVTLSSTNYATDQSRKRVLRLTGSPGASYTVTIPSVEKFYVVLNSTNASQTIKAAGIGVSIPPAVMTTVVCDGTDCFAPAQTVTAAIGTVCDFAGSTAPSGWLLCYGQAVSRSTYAALFGAIGTTYGTGDGSTTFNVPDLRGRVSAGVEAMGGSAAGRIGNAVTGSMASVALGGVGGEAYHTLNQTELPSVTPTGTVTATATASAPTATVTGNNGGAVNGALGGFAQTNGGNNQAIAAPVSAPTVTVSATLSMNSFGANGQHNNIQPTMMLNKIIYAGV